MSNDIAREGVQALRLARRCQRDVAVKVRIEAKNELSGVRLLGFLATLCAHLQVVTDLRWALTPSLLRRLAG